jgi:hypothetical protein
MIPIQVTYEGVLIPKTYLQGANEVDVVVMADYVIVKPRTSTDQSLPSTQPQSSSADTDQVSAAVKRENAWDLLEALTGTIEAPPDWASEHDHYLYGTPKRGEDTGEQ